MIEHVFARAKMFKKWDGLFLATCDKDAYGGMFIGIALDHLAYNGCDLLARIRNVQVDELSGVPST